MASAERAVPVGAVVLLLCSLVLWSGAWAHSTWLDDWLDDLTNALSFYRTTYPDTDWEPYQQKLSAVREALNRDDKRTVRSQLDDWFMMLRTRAHGISDVAADELYNFAVIVMPLQEYGVSVPSRSESGS